ncbi:MAG: Ig-like domain-containing protein [Terracidiphilus sp.]
MNCRGLRLEWVAGLGIALALTVLPEAAAAQTMATETALTVVTRDQGGHTQATASVTVTGADGQPASGVVILEDGDRQLAEAALNGEGQATSVLSLPGGDHNLRAVYAGDASHQASASATSNVTGQTSATPNFTFSLAAVPPSTLPLTLTAGQSGTIAVTITPENNAALASPMFVTLSCSGLPSEASCTFTPETVEILSTTSASCASGSPASSCPPVSSMLIQTQEHITTQIVRPTHPGHKSSPVAWAFLLPGMLGLGGLAWGGARRGEKRRWLQRLALVALMGLVTALGTTACNPLYDYYQLGPPHPPATPSGTYTVTITGQSTNGVTAITNNTTMMLTVQGGS